MKKLFLLIPALVLSLAINAKVININPGENTIRSAIYNSATSDGDVIVLADGTYTDDNYIELIKSVEIKAAEGAHPIIALNTYIKVYGGKHTILRGLSFDGSAQGSRDQYFRFTDNSDNELEIIGCTFTGVKKNIFRCESGNKFALLDVKECTFANCLSNIMDLESAACEVASFDSCEFYEASKVAIQVESAAHLNKCILKNCYFHDYTNAAINILPGSTAHACDKIEIANSTFANFSGFDSGVIEVYSKGSDFAEDPADDQEISIDHCTFYNCTKTSNSTYGVIDSRKTKNVTVSNCIFANPVSLPEGTYASKATQLYAGTVLKCLRHNVPAHRNTPSAGNDIVEDPLFNDLANNKYTYDGVYGESMSPARGAGTDGLDLGDKRWYTDVTYPETDFSGAGYTFTAAKANAPEIEKNTHYGEDAPYLRYTGSTPTYAEATWVIKATRACHVKVTVNMANNAWNYDADNTYQNGKHIFGVELWAGNVRKDTVAEGEYGNGKLDGYSTYPTVELGNIEIPAAGIYTVKLLNPRAWSKCGVESVTMAYEGGAVVTLPGTLPLAEAILSPLAYKEAGTNYIHFTDDEHVSQVPDQWVKWNVQAAVGVYSFTFEIESPNYGQYVITVLDKDNHQVFTDQYNREGPGSYTSPGIVLSGNYTIHMQNLQGHSKGYITSMSATKDNTIFGIDENKTDDGSIAAQDGKKMKLLLKRSFVAGQYYTLCIPIDSYDEELKGIFGAGYELWKMSSAVQTGEVIDLNFEVVAGNSFVNSTPYIIKPTIDAENPIFSQHTFHVNNTTKSHAAADIIGTFYKSEIPAGENNLYLKNNELFYNESHDTPIKGTRAWIQLKPQGQSAPKARIVMQGNVATEINLVNGEIVEGTVKTIENGQLIIIRDGQKFNVMGAKIQ